MTAPEQRYKRKSKVSFAASHRDRTEGLRYGRRIERHIKGTDGSSQQLNPRVKPGANDPSDQADPWNSSATL
ncbi:MAG: hypothetical protein DWQ47_10125 [Acidobacteria bacterium]|nr:MAG: hypothetical protein DWQ32_12540 [Acidobacteriota bacterium]REJ97948.1 MAG: hypothetical protein DWQ38_15340 [Acidobacteriota bacterium]REK16691.1 MAG: hypothetical protein DWQ43_00385 [Acidobacteriota bacterium]REK42602.1 MAG: hypothetical protein DWQ47_10125 [Acidobacteriota bacterium]